MKHQNNPTSCNDLIITLIIAAILIIGGFTWLFTHNINTSETNQKLTTKIVALEKISVQKIDTIKTLSSQLKQISSSHESQTIQLNKSLSSAKDQQSNIQKNLLNKAQETKILLSKVDSLQKQVNEQQMSIIQFKKDKEDVNQQLIDSKQNLKESHMLSEQQFNEFKQLKRNLIETQFDANNQLKEINEWQLEVKKLKKQLLNTKIKMSQPKQRFTVFEMDQDILFNKGEASLKVEGKKALTTLAQIFKQYPKRQIAIQGHSDNQSLGPKLKKKYNSNWELAAARAASAIYFLQHKKSISPKRIILVSYAHYRPKSQGKSQHDLALNRRIEITLMPKDFDFVRGEVTKP